MREIVSRNPWNILPVRRAADNARGYTAGFGSAGPKEAARMVNSCIRARSKGAIRPRDMDGYQIDPKGG